MKLEKVSIKRFLTLSELSFDSGIINHFVFIERLFSLKEMIDKKNTGYFNFITNYIKKFEEYYEISVKHLEEPDSSEEILTEESIGEGDILFFPDNNTLHFITPYSGKYGKWEFHLTDVDDKPSIPHGHSVEMRYKLDPYRRFVFNKRNLSRGSHIGKENKEFIIRLWNDQKFRIFASECLTNFIEKNKNYDWIVNRGIMDPKRLPKMN